LVRHWLLFFDLHFYADYSCYMYLGFFSNSMSILMVTLLDTMPRDGHAGHALHKNNYKTFHVLLNDPNINMNRLDIQEATVMMMAASVGLKGIVVSLLDAGADPRLLDKKGWSARKYAELTGNLDIAAMLESVESGVSTKAHEYL